MSIHGYLAMTPAQIRSARPLPRSLGWMSCHFSEEGIRDLPQSLPPGSLLILDDSRPPDALDLELICSQLETAIGKNGCSGLLLDFQRKGLQGIDSLVKALTQALPCPVALSETYAALSSGPVFLSLPPAHRSLEASVRPWAGRELWLEIGFGAEIITVRPEGAAIEEALSPLPPCPLADPRLCCHYAIETSDDRAVFYLRRSPQDLKALLLRAQALGITRNAALYSELPYLPL